MHESLTLCGQCGKQTVKRVKENLTSIRSVGDTILEFKVKDVPVGRCSDPECNALWFDWESCEVTEKEFRNVVAEIIRRYK
jgi:hypothetical protein